MDVWVDGQNLLRRVALSVGLPGSGTGTLHMPGNSRLAVTIDFYDYGAPVNVSAPPASQVASMAQMITSGSSSGSSFGSGISGPAATPPAVSGSLTPGQAAAAGHAVAAFWAALGHADPAAATVRFTVNATASLGGQQVPISPPGSGGAQWLAAVEQAGHWYVDLSTSEDGFVGAGPC